MRQCKLFSLKTEIVNINLFYINETEIITRNQCVLEKKYIMLENFIVSQKINLSDVCDCIAQKVFK